MSKPHPVNLAHDAAMTAANAIREFLGTLRPASPRTRGDRQTAWEQGQACVFSSCLYGAKYLEAVRPCFGNGEPVELMGKFGASAHDVVFVVAVSLWQKIEAVLWTEAPKGRVKIGREGLDFYSSHVVALWTSQTWAALCREFDKKRFIDFDRFRAKLQAEFDAAYRFLALAPELRKAFGDQLAGREPRIWRVMLGVDHRAPAFIDEQSVRLNSIQEWKVLKALEESRPNGLKKDALESVYSGARQILNRLKRDPAWAEVIDLPGQKKTGYHLL